MFMGRNRRRLVLTGLEIESELGNTVKPRWVQYQPTKMPIPAMLHKSIEVEKAAKARRQYVESNLRNANNGREEG